MSQVNRALPNLVAVAGWHGCDHLGPVREGDTLYSRISVEEVEQLPGGGVPVHLGVRARAWSASDPAERELLVWRPAVLLASGRARSGAAGGGPGAWPASGQACPPAA